jgi:hypothetical protein
MADKHIATYAIFPTRAAAETAVDRLNAAGFSYQDVSVLMSDRASASNFATEKHTKAPEGSTTGGVLGGALGGTLGLLAGIGALAIPGVGPLIAAGPIMATLAGVGVGAATGGLVGALIGAGIPEFEAKRYEGRVNDGGILVSVHCETSDEVSQAKHVLKDAGGEDVSSSGEESARSRDHEYEREHDRDRRVAHRDDVESDRVPVTHVRRDELDYDQPVDDPLHRPITTVRN